jgi:hypothetical protein
VLRENPEEVIRMNNHMFDLINALGEKAEATHVYDIYMDDAVGCESCSSLWKRLKTQDERDIEEMKQLLIDHIKNGEFK